MWDTFRRNMLRAGLIGLSSVGKTTIFRMLTQAHQTGRKDSGAHDTTVAIAQVPDERLDRLSELFTPKKHTPATVNLIDMMNIPIKINPSSYIIQHKVFISNTI